MAMQCLFCPLVSVGRPSGDRQAPGPALLLGQAYPKTLRWFSHVGRCKPVQQVRVSLNTESKAEALAKAAQVEMIRTAEWEALLVGDHGSAREHYEAARKLAAAYGFTYRPIDDLANGPLSEIMTRVSALGEADKPAPRAVARAVSGVVPVSLPDLDGAIYIIPQI